jgi:hypothetical protein
MEKLRHLPYQLYTNYRIVGSSKAKQIRALVVTPQEMAVQMDNFVRMGSITLQLDHFWWCFTKPGLTP